jgi:hypothetical protein
VQAAVTMTDAKTLTLPVKPAAAGVEKSDAKGVPVISKVLVFSSPPGGVLDSEGAFADSQTFVGTSNSTLASTSPFATAPSSGLVAFIQIGSLVVMTWPGITPAATTGGTNPSSWTWVGFVPGNISTPAVNQVQVIQAENAGTLGSSTCQVSPNGTVTFTFGTNVAPGGTTWTGNSPSLTGFPGFTMFWQSF